MTRREQLGRLYDEVGMAFESHTFSRIASNRWKRSKEGFEEIIEVSALRGRYNLAWSLTAPAAADVWWGEAPKRNDDSVEWGLLASDINTTLWPSRQPEVTNEILRSDEVPDLLPIAQALCKRLDPLESPSDVQRLLEAGPENDSIPFVHPTSANARKMLAAVFSPSSEWSSDDDGIFLSAAAALRDSASEPWVGRIARYRSRAIAGA